MYNLIPTLLGYIGPETMLPLASVLAAIMGFILMFWRYIFRLIRRMFGAIFCRKQKNVGAETTIADQSKAKKPRADGTVLKNKAVREGGGDATE
jgi:hypothetical protein